MNRTADYFKTLNEVCSLISKQHKYREKVPLPGGGFKYVYEPPATAAASAPKAHREDRTTGQPMKPVKTGKMGVMEFMRFWGEASAEQQAEMKRRLAQKDPLPVLRLLDEVVHTDIAARAMARTDKELGILLDVFKGIVDGVEKEAAPVGTVHRYADGHEYKKQQDGSWVRTAPTAFPARSQEIEEHFHALKSPKNGRVQLSERAWRLTPQRRIHEGERQIIHGGKWTPVDVEGARPVRERFAELVAERPDDDGQLGKQVATMEPPTAKPPSAKPKATTPGKGMAQAGEVRTRASGQQFRKNPDGKWVPVGTDHPAAHAHARVAQDIDAHMKRREAGPESFHERRAQHFNTQAGTHQPGSSEHTKMLAHAKHHLMRISLTGVYRKGLEDMDYEQARSIMRQRLEKGKAAQVGETRVWGGQRYTKQTGGKWTPENEEAHWKDPRGEAYKKPGTYRTMEHEWDLEGYKHPVNVHYQHEGGRVEDVTVTNRHGEDITHHVPKHEMDRFYEAAEEHAVDERAARADAAYDARMGKSMDPAAAEQIMRKRLEKRP